MKTYKSIVYQTRAYNDTSLKIYGGSFEGAIDLETVNRLVKSHFSVKIKPSGRGVFVDKEGREVWLSLTIDPERTDAGKKALHEWRVEKAKEDNSNLARVEKEEAEVQALLDGLSFSETIRRLKQEA